VSSDGSVSAAPGGCTIQPQRRNSLFNMEVDTMKTQLRSRELSCPSCVAKIEKALQAVDGVTAAKVHFNTGRIEVEHDEQTPEEALVQAVRAAGYEAEVSAF